MNHTVNRLNCRAAEMAERQAHENTSAARTNHMSVIHRADVITMLSDQE